MKSSYRDISLDESVGEKRKTSPFRLRAWIWLPITLASLMLIPVLSRRHSVDSLSADNTVPPAPQTPLLDLKVQKDGKELRFTWNKESSAVMEAERGVVWIKDGVGERRLDLDRRKLGVGSVIYWPVSNDVNFRLEVIGVAKIVSESLRYHPAPPPVIPAVATPPVPSTPAVKMAAVQPKPAQQRPAAEPIAAHPEELKPLAVESKPAPVVLPNIPTTPAIPAAPSVTIAAEAVRQAGTGFTAARAISRVTPTFPASLKGQLKGEVPVDLRVSVDKEGNVFRSEVLPGRADNRLLNAAADAAKRWRFAPARVDSKAVPSQVVIHFTFREPS